MDFVLSIVSEPRRRLRAAKPSQSTKKPKAEKPKTEKLKAEKSKVEKPKAEKLKTEKLMAEKLKTEKPKTEKLKAEKSKVEKPKTEKPKVEKLKTEKSKTEKLKTEKPKVEKPKTEKSKAEKSNAAAQKRGRSWTEEEAPVAKAPRGRESALNDLTALMSEPVEATVEGLFSSRRFSDATALHPFLRALLVDKLGLAAMTQVQAACLQPLLDGRDALVKAQTGSGKTLAFALPIVQRLQQQRPAVRRADGPRALVIAPTRELAAQTQEMFARLLQPFVRIVSGLLTGGVRRKAQKASLRRGLNVLVATPQRLLDHLRATACLDLSRLAFLVVDEADRLLEAGFERDVRHILGHLREARPQTILLSATLTPQVQAMAGLALHDPVHLHVADTMDSVALPAGLQNFVICPAAKQRLVTLAAFLLLKCRYTSKSGKVMVFMATQDAVDFHYSLFSNTIACSSDDLTLPGISTEMELFRLHGNMEHQQRRAVFRRFADCAGGGVLLATDVACRGLDLPRVAWVVQYHVPASPVDYVHRVGRTARAGGKGKALLFLHAEEREYLRVLAGLGVGVEEMEVKAVMRAALVHVNNTAARRARKKPRLLHSTMEAAVRLQRDLEYYVDDSECKALAEQAFLSYLRFYASFSGPMRDIFRFKALHLGHVAKTFALRGAPKDIAARVTGRAPRKLAAAKSSEPEAGQGSSLDRSVAQKHMLAEFGI